MAEGVLDAAIRRHTLGVLGAVGFGLLRGEGEGHHTGVIAQAVGEAARDDWVVGVVGRPVREGGDTGTQSALVEALGGQRGGEGFLAVERGVLDGEEPVDSQVRVPVIAAPAGATIAAVLAEVIKVDVGGRHAEQGAVGAVPVGVVGTATEGCGFVNHGAQEIVVAVQGGLIGAHQVTRHGDGTLEGVEGDFHVHVALGAIEGALAVVGWDFHHHLTVCAGEVGGGAVGLLGGVGGAEVVLHGSGRVHDASAHLALNGQFLMQGSRTDAGEVWAGIVVVVAYAVDLVVAVVRDDLLLPAAVVDEEGYLPGKEGEAAEAGVVAARSAGHVDDINVAKGCGVKDIGRYDYPAHLVGCAEFTDNLQQDALMDGSRDSLRTVGTDCSLDVCDEVVILCHIIRF